MKNFQKIAKRVIGGSILFLGLPAMIMCLVIYLPTDPRPELLEKVDNELEKHHIFFAEAEYAILIDYYKPVFKRRLWVIELKTGNILMNAHVSHAVKSGRIYAKTFSNQENSYLSCAGTFKAMYSYESCIGEAPYNIGMRIDGLDWGRNDAVLARDIVFHCSSKRIWSNGCFMTLPKVNKQIIELTSNGSIIVVDAPEPFQ